MLKIAVVLDEYGIDYLPLYKRTSDESKRIGEYENNISDSGPYNAGEINIIVSLNLLNDVDHSLNMIGLIEQKRQQEALEIIITHGDLEYTLNNCIEILSFFSETENIHQELIAHFSEKMMNLCLKEKNLKKLLTSALIFKKNERSSESNILVGFVIQQISTLGNTFEKINNLIELHLFFKETKDQRINKIDKEIINLIEEIIKSGTDGIEFIVASNRILKHKIVEQDSQLAKILLGEEKNLDKLANFLKGCRRLGMMRGPLFWDSLFKSLPEENKSTEIINIFRIATANKVKIYKFDFIIDEAKDLKTLKQYIEILEKIQVEDSALVHERISIKLLSFKELDMALEYSKKITKFSNKANVYLAILDFYIIQSDIDAFKKLLYEIAECKS